MKTVKYKVKTDIHTHILPGMDDGAKNLQESLALISLLKKQDIDLVVLTPHFYPHMEDLSEFLLRRNSAFSSIADSGLNMLLAGEIYLSHSLFAYETVEQLLIGNRRYMLLELPLFAKWDGVLFNQIDCLIKKHRVKPIIAHIERYEAMNLHKSRALLKLKDLGCFFQINIGSVTDKKTRAFTLKLIKGGWADFVGSDCHDLIDRAPQFDIFNRIVGEKLLAEHAGKWNQPLYI